MASKCMGLDFIPILQRSELWTNDKSGELKLVWAPTEARIGLIINEGKLGRN